MPENNKRDRETKSLSPEIAEARDLQFEEYEEGAGHRAPSFMTNETDETNQAETNIASSLALFGMDADIRTFPPWPLPFWGMRSTP